MDSEALLPLRTEESCRHIASKCSGEIEFSLALDTFHIFLKLTKIDYLRANESIVAFIHIGTCYRMLLII